MSQLAFATAALTADGGSTGLLTVTTNAAFAPGAIVYLSSSAVATKPLKIRSLVGSTQILVYDPTSSSFFTNFNASAYLTTDTATLTQPPQENTAANDNGIESPLTTKGDLYGFSTGPDRFAVGTDTYVLTADSTQPFGIKWATGGGGGITSFGAVGSSPSANGATVSGAVATLQAATASFPGVVTAGTQAFGGNKTLWGVTSLLSELVVGTDAASNTTSATTNDIRGATLLAGGTADQAGADLTIKTGSGKGAGTPPTVIIQAPAVGSTGTTLTTPTTVATFAAAGVTLVPGLIVSSSALYAITMPASTTIAMNSLNSIFFGATTNNVAALNIRSNVTHVTFDNVNNQTIFNAPMLAIRAVTQNATTPVTVSASVDNRRLFTNVGSGATQVVYNLSAATVGLDHSFTCEDSGGIVIDANGTDQIRYVSTAGTGILGGAGGTITTTVQGASIRISCHKAGFWSVQSVIGTIGAAATNWVVT